MARYFISLFLLTAIACSCSVGTEEPSNGERADSRQLLEAAGWKEPEGHQEDSWGEFETLLEKHGLKLVHLDTWEEGTLNNARVVDGEDVVYSLNASSSARFLEREGILYHAAYHRSSTGCAVVALDLKARRQLWETHLEGVGPVDHSKYSNDVRIEPLLDETLAVYGKESAGSYVEIVDMKTGKIVGHRKVGKGK